MYRGCSLLNIDNKGRLAVPTRYRPRLTSEADSSLVLALNPWEKSLLLYPSNKWALIDAKLARLPDTDRQSRRIKQMMWGYASDCHLDGQNRILIPQELRDYAGLSKQVAFLGQGNKFEIWDGRTWGSQRDQWLDQIGNGDNEVSSALGELSL